MKRFLFIIFSAKSGICPIIVSLKDSSQVKTEVKKCIYNMFKDESPVCAETYLLLDNDSLNFFGAFSYDGVNFWKCCYYRPSNEAMEYHVNHSIIKSI